MKHIPLIILAQALGLAHAATQEGGVEVRLSIVASCGTTADGNAIVTTSCTGTPPRVTYRTAPPLITTSNSNPGDTLTTVTIHYEE